MINIIWWQVLYFILSTKTVSKIKSFDEKEFPGAASHDIDNSGSLPQAFQLDFIVLIGCVITQYSQKCNSIFLYRDTKGSPDANESGGPVEEEDEVRLQRVEFKRLF